jgi:hypothetical protein
LTFMAPDRADYGEWRGTNINPDVFTTPNKGCSPGHFGSIIRRLVVREHYGVAIPAFLEPSPGDTF